jgi:hypothetical protein
MEIIANAESMRDLVAYAYPLIHELESGIYQLVQ